jgi:hypothetical protein
MNNLSTDDGADISSQIGALELGDAQMIDDGALLRSAETVMSPPPTQPRALGGYC